MSDIIFSEVEFDPKLKNYSVVNRKLNGKNSVSFQFGKGEHLTLDEKGENTMLNASNHRNLINNIVQRGYLVGVYIDGEILLFSNQGNSLVKNILRGSVDSEIVNIEDELKPNFTCNLTLKDSSSDLDQGFRDNSINSLDLNISFPAIKSYARVFNGKINIHIDEEEKNNQEIIQKINDEILKLKENGLICDIPNFSLSKPQNNPDSNVSGKSSPFIPHMPTRNKHIIDWPEDSTDELQTTVNIVHPQIRNLF